MAIMAATVWFIPGWLRSEAPSEDVMESVANAFPASRVEFKAWDGDNVVWPLSVDSADKESWRFAFEIAMMPQDERESLTLVGHSLGGRIVARVLARLSENGMKVRQAVLMGAANSRRRGTVRQCHGPAGFPDSGRACHGFHDLVGCP